jgi:hypothetical protein
MDLTPEQIEDIKQRKEFFLKEYDELSKKYQLEHVSGPILTTIGPNLFGITMISDVRDTKYLPTPSPFNGSDKI